MQAVLWPITMRDVRCHPPVSLCSLYRSEFLTISAGERKMHSAAPIDRTSNGGADHAWQTCLIKQGGRQRKTDEQKARLTARVSHHDK